MSDSSNQTENGKTVNMSTPETMSPVDTDLSNLSILKQRPINELVQIAEEMGVENFSRMRKQDMIFSILKLIAKQGHDIYGEGVLEILPDGFGFLRSASGSYLAGPEDIYV